MRERLEREHREIESALESLAADVDAVRVLRKLLEHHYAGESEYLEQFGARVAAKLREQHAEALELAVRLEESMEAGDRDAAYLLRRLVAIVQHNIIEEERDVFRM